jgi:AcrR family transcriptional regulator
VPDPNDAISRQLALLRRAQILDAATAVFAERGFHRATIRDVARAAGIADGTIYLYFPSKSDLLVGILDRLNESTERESRFAAGSRDDFRAFFATYLRQRFELLWPNAEVFRAVLPEMLANPDLRRLYYDRVIAPTFALAERHFAAEIARGRMRPLDVPLTVRSLAALPLGLLVLGLLGDAEVASRWSKLPETVAALLLDGLSRDSASP